MSDFMIMFYKQCTAEKKKHLGESKAQNSVKTDIKLIIIKCFLGLDQFQRFI